MLFTYLARHCAKHTERPNYILSAHQELNQVLKIRYTYVGRWNALWCYMQIHIKCYGSQF